MSDIVYADMVRTLAKPGKEIRASLLPVNASILSAAIGVFAQSADILNHATLDSIFSSDESTHLWHMAVGIAGEAGELLDVIKKICIYNKPVTDELRANIVEELGDIHFYVTGYEQGEPLEPRLKRFLVAELNIIYDAFEISTADVEAANIAKLGKRYEGLRYSDAAAIARADKTESGETVSSGVQVEAVNTEHRTQNTTVVLFNR